MFTINKDKLFNILNNINTNCMYKNIKDKSFNDVKKFTRLLDKIDLNRYAVDYIQNRLIVVRPKITPINYFKNLIICPFDNEFAIQNEECESITYTFPTKERKSYLAPENTPLNESYCIKGFMNPGILNAITIYMLDTGLIPEDTMVVFSVKANFSKRDCDDIIEYLQKYMNAFNNNLQNIIVMDYTMEEKSYPRKDYIGKFNSEGTLPEFSHHMAKKLYDMETVEFRRGTNYDVNINRLPNFREHYRKLMDYFRCQTYNECRLFVFSDKPVSSKYSYLLKGQFMTEWNSVEKYINILTNMIKRGE